MLSDPPARVSVIGLGYIDLPTAAAVARSGCPVPGIDVTAHDRGTGFGYAGAGRRRARHGDTIILESTSPVGTTEKSRDPIAGLRPDLRVPGRSGDGVDLAIACCPERVLPGRILHELVAIDRCIGGITPRCARNAMGFYRCFVRGQCITTTPRVAEMVKLTENASRDVDAG